MSAVSYLVPGDIRQTLPALIEKGQCDRFSANSIYSRLVYIDVSAYEPSMIGLQTLYNRVTPGGIIAIDQRRQGGEWNAFMEFCSSKISVQFVDR